MFGLNVAPEMFAEMTKIIQMKVSLQGVERIFNLDGCLLLGESRQAMEQGLSKVLKVVELVGFTDNLQKSKLVLEQEIQWLKPR